MIKSVPNGFPDRKSVAFHREPEIFGKYDSVDMALQESLSIKEALGIGPVSRAIPLSEPLRSSLRLNAAVVQRVACSCCSQVIVVE